MLTAAIIGCGTVAGGYDDDAPPDHVKTHARAYINDARTTLLAVADIDAGRARAFAERWRVPAWFDSAAAMLEETRPDIVSVCTPDGSHTEMLRQCLRRGVKGVWCEKPIGGDVAESARIVEEFERAGIPLAVNYMRRWDPAFAEIGKVIARGEVGDVRTVVALYGKGWLHNGSHILDLLLWWLGPIERTEAATPASAPYRGDPTLDVVLRFESGPRAHLIGTDFRDYAVAEIDILGSEGRILVTRGLSKIETFGTEPHKHVSRVLGAARERAHAEEDRIMAHPLSNLIGAVTQGETLACDGHSALETLRQSAAALDAVGSE